MEVPEGGVKSKPVTEDEINENLDDYGKPNPRIKLPNVEEQMALPPAKFIGLEELRKREEEKRKTAEQKKNSQMTAALGTIGSGIVNTAVPNGASAGKEESSRLFLWLKLTIESFSIGAQPNQMLLRLSKTSFS